MVFLRSVSKYTEDLQVHTKKLKPFYNNNIANDLSSWQVPLNFMVG